MRIGVYLGTLDPIAGGGFTFQDTIFRQLREDRGAHSFVTFYEGPASPDAGEELIALESGAPDSSDTPLALACKKNHVDVMWFLGPYFQRVEVPCVITVWDLQHRLQPFFPEVSLSGWKWEDRESFFENSLPRAAAVFVGTNVGRQEVIHFYRLPPERVQVIRFPTPTFALNSMQVPRSSIVPGQPYLYYPAQFWPHKNHIAALLALRILLDRHGIQFELVFSGADYGNLTYIEEQTAELGLTPNQVHFVGFVSREDVISLYQNAFALVYPSFFGPDNIPPIEAFGLGCPVIAADVPGADEQLGDAALRFDPRDENAFALAIKRLYEEPDLRTALIERGKTRARGWTAKDYVDKALTHFDALAPIRRCWSKTVPYRDPWLP
jgi:glycosyltransferase involved in cell wall biosynthesis